MCLKHVKNLLYCKKKCVGCLERVFMIVKHAYSTEESDDC